MFDPMVGNFTARPTYFNSTKDRTGLFLGYSMGPSIGPFPNAKYTGFFSQLSQNNSQSEEFFFKKVDFLAPFAYTKILQYRRCRLLVIFTYLDILVARRGSSLCSNVNNKMSNKNQKSRCERIRKNR